MNVDPEHERPDLPPERHGVLWFPDGNVVLQTDTLLFRVHKSVLSLQSSVFKGMFELAGVEGDELNDTARMGMELYEGVPLVVLAGDKGGDVAHLLQTIYEHGYYLSSSDDHPLTKITALLLLSTKYDFKKIRMDVVSHLLRHYPPTLSEFDSIDYDLAPSFQSIRSSDHFKLLKVALVVEADSLLPGLYYACSDYPIQSILTDLGEELDDLSLRTLLRGRELLAKAVRKVQWIYIAESEHCVKVHSSSLDFRLEDPGPSEIFDTTDLKDIAGKTLSTHWPGRLCQNCRPRTERLVDEEREKVWNELPSYFGLPKWDVLLVGE